MDTLRDNATILLVEDDDTMRTVMSNLLKKRGYRVLAALDSREALRIAAAHGPPDLLISRPEPELAGHLARLRPQLPVLYLGDMPTALPHKTGDCRRGPRCCKNLSRRRRSLRLYLRACRNPCSRFSPSIRTSSISSLSLLYC
jgi:DNA-binding NarL/FixJ family response regulator